MVFYFALISSLICISLMTKDGEHLFVDLLAISLSLLNYLFKSFACCYIGLLIFPLLCCRPFVKTCTVPTSSQSGASFIILFGLSFKEPKFSILMQSYLSHFLSFMLSAFSILRNLCKSQRHQDILLFSSRSFIILAFMIGVLSISHEFLHMV